MSTISCERLFKKYFLTEMYRNIQTFAFWVHGECSSWVSRNRAVPIFFLTSTRNIVAGKFVKWVTFLVVLLDHIFIMLSDSKLVKRVRFFERNYIVQWVFLFASFCWLWDFPLQNLKLKEKLQIWNFESLIFCYKFRLFGTVLGLFSQCILKVFAVGQT